MEEREGAQQTHFSQRQVELYLERKMTPAELLEADDHLACCHACREELARSKQPEALLSSIRAGLNAEAKQAPKHLAYEQLAAYVDDEIDEVEREIVDSHMAVCQQCKEEMRDLFAFKKSLNRANEIEPAVQTAPGFLERFLSPIPAAFNLSPLQLAGGLAVLRS
jgi:anti-sigma factor RsiW